MTAMGEETTSVRANVTLDKLSLPETDNEKEILTAPQPVLTQALLAE